MENDRQFSKAFILYKPKNDGNGAASQFALSSNKNSVFLEMARQKKDKDNKGNFQFDWDNKIRFKLGETDIGEILAVLMGLQKGVGPFDTAKDKHKGLFHSNPNGNAILYFWKDEHERFRIYLSVKRDNNQSVVKHSISKGEACILGTLLRRAIEIMYLWD